MTQKLPTSVMAAVMIALLAGAAAPAAASVEPDPATPMPTPTLEPAEGSTPAPSRTPTPAPTVDPVREAEYWLDDIGITEAWETTRGAGTTIAVIDTGVADGIVELDDSVVGGVDVSGVGADDGRTPVGVQDQDHGTYVASLAAARGTGDDTGMIGVAPEAEILSVSIGFGSSAAVPFAEQIAEAMRWSVDNGADIINLSFTTNQLTWDESWDEAFLYAAERDVMVVVAAGNRGSGTNVVGAPATIPGVLTVAGVDRNGLASERASTQGITIGVSAPSEELLGITAGGELVQWAGTSGSAPIVAGIAALVRSAHPELSVADVINRITSTATEVEAATAAPDALYGYGIVNAAAAVADDVPSVNRNPMGDLAQWIQLYRRAEAAPEPTPTLGAVTLPAIPPAERPSASGPAWLPSEQSLREVTLPLVSVTGAGILIALGAVTLIRRARSMRSQR